MAETRLEMQQTQKLSQNMRTVIHLLSLDLEGLSEYMIKAVGENPALEYVPPRRSPMDYAAHVKSRFHGDADPPGKPEIPAPADTAMDDLEQQLRACNLTESVRRTGLLILRTLNAHGYFMQDLDEFASEAGVSPKTAAEALAAVQALEPPGVGARDLKECLTLQLSAQQGTDPLCVEMIRRYLPEIGKGNLRRIARELGAPLPRVQQCVETIRSLTPFPCSLYEEAVQYVMPEFSVEAESNGQLTIQFHHDYYPTFRQDPSFCRLAETMSGDERAYAQELLRTASRLTQALELRQSTMEKVARVIVREQRSFFLGQGSLVPLRVDDTAREVGVHETTVYRAVQNKYLDCSRGTFRLNYFFQRELSGGSSAAQAKELIRELCRGHDRMSDREIAEALEARGVRLSRRTVAKYRAQMDIDSSFRRREDE